MKGQNESWRIHRPNKKEEKVYLELLQKHFRDVSTFEKHPDAMLNIIFTKIYNRILGEDYNKKRVSKRKEKKIRDELLTIMRKKYGRWINLFNFSFKTPHNAVYQTNFNRVYKIKKIGTLYGSPSNNMCGNVFYTSHCLERFEERVDSDCYNPLTINLRREYKAEPTCADIIIRLVLSSNLEYALKDEFCYLNIHVGAIVLENLGDVFIAKTFLSPEMLKDLQWYLPLIKKEEYNFNSFGEVLKKENIKIKEPKFLNKEITEKLLELLLSKEK